MKMVCMRQNFSKYILLLFIFALLGCGSNSESFNLKDGLRNTIGVNIDSIYSEVDFIPIELTNERLLSKNPSIVYADDKNFIIKSENNIYVYDLGGRFLREIGKYGKGHGEHGKITNCFYDNQNDIVYICSFGNEIFKYRLNGEYIKKITINNPDECVTRAFGLIDNSKLIGVRYVYKQTGLECYATIYDDRGNADEDWLIYSDMLSFQLTTESFPIVYSFNADFKVKLPFENKLYKITNKGDAKYEEFDISNLSPSRDLVENCENKFVLYNEKCQILDIVETSNHLYIICFYAMKYHSVIIDKETKNVIFSDKNANPKEVGSLSYGDKRINFWPSFACNNKVYCLVNIDDTTQRKYGLKRLDRGNTDTFVIILQEF